MLLLVCYNILGVWGSMMLWAS